jgi:hypothetical protein
MHHGRNSLVGYHLVANAVRGARGLLYWDGKLSIGKDIQGFILTLSCGRGT